MSTHHGVGLAATCLPVGEDGAIVAVKYAFDEEEGTLFVDEALCAVWGEDVVEGEGFGLLFVVFFFEIDLLVFGIDLHDVDATYLEQAVPLSFSLAFIGLHLTMTLTASAMCSPDKNII